MFIFSPFCLMYHEWDISIIFTFLMSGDIFVIKDFILEGFWLGIFWKRLRKNSEQNTNQESALTHIHPLSTPPL